MNEIKTHSKLGASSAERWFNCPGSVALCDLAPKKADTEYSIEGTNAHSFMEFMLKRPNVLGKFALPNAAYYINREKEFGLDFKITLDMAVHVQNFVDQVLYIFHQLKGAVLLVEQKFHLKHIHPMLFGTCDVAIIQPFGKIYVIDFKYGAGIGVDPVENSQLLYYGTGAVFGQDYSEVILVIAQPRIQGSEWQEWSTTPEYMIEFSKKLKQKAIATEKPNAPLASGDHCRWCAAASFCPELQKKANEVAKLDFAEPNAALPEVTKMSDAQIVRLIENKEILLNWIKAVENGVYLRLMSGEKIEGLKLVRGKNSREWEDEDVVLANFGDKIKTKPTIMSVAAAEKALGKAAVAGFVQTIPGGYKVAHESSSKPEVKNVQDEFKVIEDKKNFSLDDF